MKPGNYPFQIATHLAFCSQVFWYKEVTDANESGGEERTQSARELTRPSLLGLTLKAQARRLGRADGCTHCSQGFSSPESQAVLGVSWHK